jgi:dihydroorotate dehydrogenase
MGRKYPLLSVQNKITSHCQTYSKHYRYTEPALAAEKGGADAISIINTLLECL